MSTITQSKCKSCGCPIVWAKSPAGKTIPIDVRAPVYKISLLDGEAVAEKITSEEEIYGVTHFATCPQAASHSKGGVAANRDHPSDLVPPEGKSAYEYVPVRWPLPKMFEQPATDAQKEMAKSKAKSRVILDDIYEAVRASVASCYGIHACADSKAGYALFIDWLVNAEDHSISEAEDFCRGNC